MNTQNEREMGSGQRLLNISKAYAYELEGIKARNISGEEKAKLSAKAEKKFVDGLKAINVGDEAIAAIGAAIKKAPEQQAQVLEVLKSVTDKKLAEVIRLQSMMAEDAYRLNKKTADATASITAVGAMVSTVARYFGFNEFADSVDKTTDEIKSKISLKLNTDGIGAGTAEMVNNYNNDLTKTVIDIIQRTKVISDSNIDPGMGVYVKDARNAPAASSPATSATQATPAARPSGVTWSTLEKGLEKQGVDKQSRDKILKVYAGVADDEGDISKLDSMKEAAALITAIKKEASLNKFVPQIREVINQNDLALTAPAPR